MLQHPPVGCPAPGYPAPERHLKMHLDKVPNSLRHPLSPNLLQLSQPKGLSSGHPQMQQFIQHHKVIMPYFSQNQSFKHYTEQPAIVHALSIVHMLRVEGDALEPKLLLLIFLTVVMVCSKSYDCMHAAFVQPEYNLSRGARANRQASTCSNRESLDAPYAGAKEL